MSDDNALKTGDVVRLKSGGPHMTVSNIGDNYGTPTVWCCWFERTTKVEDTFTLGSLEKVK